jgi:hypothetical protein
VAPAASAATAAPAQPEAPAARAGSPDIEVDPIAAAINAVTRLPQRAPGATRTGRTMPGAAPVASTGGSLFQRLRASEAAEAAKKDLPQREPSTPTQAFGAIDDATAQADADAKAEESRLDLSPASPTALQDDAEQHAASTLEDVVTPLPSAPATPLQFPRRGGLSNFHPLNGSRVEATSNGALSNDTGDAEDPVEPVEPVEAVGPVEPVEAVDAIDAVELVDSGAPVADDEAAPAASWLPSVASAPAAAPAADAVYDLLDSRSPMPEPTEDETPIFRTLRSRWLSSAGDATWTKSEIEAGWEAAEEIAEKAPTQVSQAGLPMRRPGNRLVPGGVAPAPVNVARDPEAIRARLAAHAAGVSRGRTAAVDEHEHVPAQSTTTEEGPA